MLPGSRRLSDSTQPLTHVGTNDSSAGSWIKMEPPREDIDDKKGADGNQEVERVSADRSSEAPPLNAPTRPNGADSLDASQRHSSHYRVYKRRWFGLFQLILLNTIVSWDWLTFAPVSATSAQYFGVTESEINWLSTGFLFAFAFTSPVTIWALNRGPKVSIIFSSVFILCGNWIRYAGTRATGGHYGVVMFGQIMIGFAQPFVLAAPTRYSDLWFTKTGRIAATAVVSLANPFGGALAQLIVPFWVSSVKDVPNMVLYTTVMSTVASLPSFFVPSNPPTPAAASSSIPKTPIKESLSLLFRNPSVYALCIPFAIYCGFFNSFSSVINQVLEPYDFTADQAGICGAILIVTGLVSAAIISPIIDRTHTYLLAIRLLVPIIAISDIAFIFAPATRSLVAPYVIAAILGASSFALVPIALEYLVEITWPVSPEVGSTLTWTAGQVLGACFILIMDALKGAKGEPVGSMKRGLIFQAIVACVILPLPLCLGIERFGFGAGAIRGRLALDEADSTASEVEPPQRAAETAAV